MSEGGYGFEYGQLNWTAAGNLLHQLGADLAVATVLRAGMRHLAHHPFRHLRCRETLKSLSLPPEVLAAEQDSAARDPWTVFAEALQRLRAR